MFEEMPIEIQYYIGEKLSIRDLNNLRLVSKKQLSIHPNYKKLYMWIKTLINIKYEPFISKTYNFEFYSDNNKIGSLRIKNSKYIFISKFLLTNLPYNFYMNLLSYCNIRKRYQFNYDHKYISGKIIIYPKNVILLLKSILDNYIYDHYNLSIQTSSFEYTRHFHYNKHISTNNFLYLYSNDNITYELLMLLRLANRRGDASYLLSL